MKSRDKIDIIVLNWNGEKLLKEFLPKVVANTDSETSRIVIADNGSDDASLSYVKSTFPDVEILEFKSNYGFAEGYNRAIAASSARYVILLNSDAYLAKGSDTELCRYMDGHPDVGACQPKLLSYKNPQYFEYAGACGGYLDRDGYPYCRGRIFSSCEKDTGQYDEPQDDLMWASGAALMVRREIYLACGGLDARFFAHMEEIDLCWRLKNSGYILKVVPSSVVYHLGGGSLPMNHPRKLFLNYRNNLLMLHKNLGGASREKVFFIRLLFDCMAGMLFLLKGEFSNTRSIIQAYKAFREMKKGYPVPSEAGLRAGIYPRSIILDYFLRGKKKFSDLKF